MATRGSGHRLGTLTYPSDRFSPNDWLAFTELPGFWRRWEQLKLGDLNLTALQAVIMAAPKMAPVVKETGGLRKLRLAPIGSEKGKSGGVRVWYLYVEEVATVVLAIVYAKGEKDDLTKKEKATLRALVERYRTFLLSRPYRASQRLSTEDR